MKKSELVKIIKTAVKEELNESLPKIVNELLKGSENATSVDPVELTKEVLSVPKKKVKKELKRYSKNEALNQVLNETVGGIPTEGSRVGGVDKHTDLNGQEVDINSLPDHVSSALTRDYSKLLGAVETKKKQKMGIV